MRQRRPRDGGPIVADHTSRVGMAPEVTRLGEPHATIAERIRRLLPTLPAAERRVARVLLNNYPVAGLETIARVAERSGTSGPTVLRLASRLGMSGYPELQQALRGELDARNRSPLSAYTTRPADDGNLRDRAAAIFAASVPQSLAAIEETDFLQAIDLLTHPKNRVFTIGGRFSGVVAQYLAALLQQLRPAVTAMDTADQVSTLLDLTRRDVVVAFDFRRYQHDVVTFGQAAAKQGAKLVLITDPWMSPLSTVADVVLTTEVVAPSPFNSLVPCFAMIETLVAGAVDALGEKPRQRMAAFDDYWFERYGIPHAPP